MMNFLKNFFIKLKDKEKIRKHLDWEKNLLRKAEKKEKFRFPNFRQLKYLYPLLTKKEKLIFIIFILIFILSSFAFLIRVYLKLPIVPTKGGEYREGVIGEPKLINPLFSLKNDPDQDLTKLIFSGLVKWENGEIKPDLAEKWEIKNEGRVYRFWLKKEIIWHDGKKISTDDIIFTVKAIQNEKIKSPLKESLNNVKIEKKDDDSIEFSLENQFSPFLTFLTFGILPKHLWEKIPPENFISSELNLSPVGSGPFKFKNLSQDEIGKIRKITLEKNKKYYLALPYLEKIHFKFFDSYTDAFEALMTKKIDGLSYARVIEELKISPKIINFYKVPLSYYTAIFFNQESKILSSKKIRKALALSLDKKEVIEELDNIELIESAIINQEFRFDQIQKYEYSPSLAEKFLKEDGYTKKKEWFVDKKGKILEINFVILNRPVYKKIGEGIKKLWEDIGIKTNLEILEKEDFEKATREKTYGAILYSIIEGYDPDPFTLWHSSQIKNGLNLANFKDIKVDVLLEKARMTLNKEERKKYYQEFQKIISEEVPAIFLYQIDLIYFQDKKIKGFETNFLPFSSDRFSQIENWYILTKRGR